jgi:hypothetical protein
MPSKARIDVLYRALLDAAVDQPRPTMQLRIAIDALLLANTSALRLQSEPQEMIAKPLENDQ